MKRLLTAMLAATFSLAAISAAVAEDIDLFVQRGSGSDLPNVLFMVDNTANWNTPFENEMATLMNAFASLPLNDDRTPRFRVGVMFAAETGGNDSNVGGGYVRAAIRNMDEATKAKYVEMFRTLDKLNDKGNGGKSGLQMAEAYRYFAGGAPYAGNNKLKTDYLANSTGLWPNNVSTTASRAAAGAIMSLTGNASIVNGNPIGFNGNAIIVNGPDGTAKSGTSYNSPIPPGYCGRNYIIYISNGPNQQAAADNAITNTMLSQAGGSTQMIALSPSGSQENPSDEWARFMANSPLRVTTYTLDVDRSNTGQGPGWSRLLRSMAEESGGTYKDVSSQGSALGIEIGKILSQIQSVNSVFASVSLPVSVNTEGTYLNQVYVGMFRPDADMLPRWTGNMKQYKLALLSGQLRTVDADGELAINSGTGFIQSCARSFWTPTIADGYWSFLPAIKQQGTCIGFAKGSNTPDGEVVEKGAQAFLRRSSVGRTVLTCSSVFADCSAPGGLITYNTLNTGLASDMVNWSTGLDVADEDRDFVTTDEMRPSVHGDVVHSRPIAINYGTADAPKVVVYYAANDGILRAINGNRSDAFDGIPAGREIWAFMPPEFVAAGHVQRLRANSPEINFVVNSSTDATPKPYGMDGAITTSGNSIFVGMRRGGRSLYAFDVTNIVGNPTATPAVSPATPSLLWKKGCPSASMAVDTGCSSDFSQIGQTWSAAKPLKTAGYVSGGVPAPMLIMGGGYDPCEDADVPTDACKNNGKGRVIYVLDAATGTRLKALPTDRGVVGDVFVINDSTGKAKFAYAADLGGNVYRISGQDPYTPFNATDPSNWNITKIASLGCNTANGGCTSNRKFMFMPDVVEKDGVYYLLLGSGDREKPLRSPWTATYGVTNYFFMLKDMPSDTNWLSAENSTCSGNVICRSSLLEIGSGDPDPDLLAAKKGWYLLLNANEQVVTSAITVFGTTTFSTHTPVVNSPGSCTSTLGTARVYNIRFLNAAARVGANRSAEISGGGLPPSPVAGQVTIDGVTYPFVIGSDSSSPLQSRLPTNPSTGTQPKSLTYWYLEK